VTRAAIVISALALAALPARAQDAPIPDSGQPLRIERIADIPEPLRQAIDRSGCRLGEVTLSTFAILIFRPAAGVPPIATVPCEGLVLHGRAFLLDGTALSFPVLVFGDRLSETETPGFFSWDARAKTLTALQGNDECEGTVMRHTYRHDGGASGGFALIKSERGRLGCGFGENWVVVWEAR
jgi:hypothetical protein